MIFANTSAEHPTTFQFAADCCERIESEFAIPCFWFEFCTVEDAWRGMYRRKLAYRLVTRAPIEEDPNGFRSRGEVFEEFLSFQGMLPNPHSRSCTAKLKLYPLHLLLEDYFGGTDGPPHQGHFGEDRLQSPEAALRRHLASGGKMSKLDFERRISYVASRPPSRPKQRWRDYSRVAKARSPKLEANRAVQLWGPNAAEFVTLLGLRSDEKRRVDRVLGRSLFAEGAGGRECAIRTQPPGERPYFPLFDSGWSAESVADYWAARDPVDIPAGASNCVFCFMKGTKQLQELANSPDANRECGTPSDIAWWDQMERRYRREVPSRDGCGVSKFGFLGVKGPTFAQVADSSTELGGRYSNGSPACDCTD